MKTTVFHDEFKKLGAFMADFGGWDMPIYVSGIKDEHFAVRENVGMFDVSHMSFFTLKNSKEARNILAADLTNKKSGDAVYSLILNENGGIVDDTIVYIKNDDELYLVANAGNDEKVKNWFAKFGVKIELENRAAIALQGPKSKGILSQIIDLPELGYFKFYENEDMLVARTGYTGELGYELYIKSDPLKIWQKLVDAGVKICGLGARDILRLEAGYPLYGHELNDETTPFEAGLAWSLKKEIKRIEPKKKLVGLELPDRKFIPRAGAQIKNGGVVTSGSYSFYLEKTIALAYTSLDLKEVEVEIRGKQVPAKVVKKSFYYNPNIRS